MVSLFTLPKAPVTPSTPYAPTCNPDHYTWFDRSRQRRTCQEYATRKMCTDTGGVGKRWKKKKTLSFSNFTNFGFSAENCPQCGCQAKPIRNPDLVVPAINGTCDTFSLWHKLNMFKMKNFYVGEYELMPNVKFNGHAVYKQKGRIVYAVSFGNSWVLTNFFKSSYFQFKLEGQETECPARESLTTEKTWEVWKRHEFRLKQLNKSSKLYYELSQWHKIITPIGMVLFF